MQPSQILRRLTLALVGLSFVGCALKAPPDVAYQSARPFDAGLSDAPQGDGAVADSNVADTQGPGGGFGDASTPTCLPSDEQCNDEDDDCDGRVDEDFPELGAPCVLNTGQCETMGYQVCNEDAQGDALLTCRSQRQSTAPVAESCDGLDNDCDGATDEALSQVCYEGPVQTVDIGVCVAGMQTCENAAWRACTGQVLPTEEACNGRDDDCDGTTDENLTRACYGGPEETAGVGECRRGRAACTGGSWGDCANAKRPVNETCNGRDDDCDGVTDEIFDGLGDPCSVGVGACRVSGNLHCSNGEIQCDVSPRGPIAELCDGLDNDCDGQTDETFDLVTRCIVGIGECARSAVPVCRADGQGTRCPVSPGQPVAEGIMDGGEPATCDGYDNDCDRGVDEQFLGCCIDGVLDAGCIARNIPGTPP